MFVCFDQKENNQNPVHDNPVFLPRLQALLARETLLSTLARLLREDGPRSLDMATAVAGCFYACSCVKDLHRQLLDNQVRSFQDGV